MFTQKIKYYCIQFPLPTNRYVTLGEVDPYCDDPSSKYAAKFRTFEEAEVAKNVFTAGNLVVGIVTPAVVVALNKSFNW